MAAPPRRAGGRHPALGEGAFPLPISTVDWLVSRESPAARFVALRDLMGRPAKDLELRKAKQAIPRDPFVRDVLALLKKRLVTAIPPAELERRYEGGYWLTLFLVEMGCDATLPEIRHAGDVLFARWERVFVDVEREERPVVNLRLFSMICRALALMGHAADSRILAGAEFLARMRFAGSAGRAEEGFGPLAKDLLLFAAVPEEKRSFLVKNAIDFSIQRAVAFPPAKGEKFGFPVGDEPDRLELLDALAAVGAPLVPPLKTELSRAAERADHRARWKLERSLNEKMPVTLERPGELSRWVTIRALRVMQHFLGLTVE